MSVKAIHNNFSAIQVNKCQHQKALFNCPGT